MISIENQVVDEIITALATAYPTATVGSEYTRTSSKFPFVEVVEMDNSVLQRASTLSQIEVMATLTYEIQIFSNKKSGKKAECKTIAAIVDGVMESLGFYRMMLNQVLNYEDATIYRMVGRWQKIQGK